MSDLGVKVGIFDPVFYSAVKRTHHSIQSCGCRAKTLRWGMWACSHTDMLQYEGSVMVSMLCSAIIGFCGRFKSCAAPGLGLGTARRGLRAGVDASDGAYIRASTSSRVRTDSNISPHQHNHIAFTK